MSLFRQHGHDRIDRPTNGDLRRRHSPERRIVLLKDRDIVWNGRRREEGSQFCHLYGHGSTRWSIPSQRQDSPDTDTDDDASTEHDQ